MLRTILSWIFLSCCHTNYCLCVGVKMFLRQKEKRKFLSEKIIWEIEKLLNETSLVRQAYTSFAHNKIVGYWAVLNGNEVSVRAQVHGFFADCAQNENSLRSHECYQWESQLEVWDSAQCLLKILTFNWKERTSTANRSSSFQYN